MSELCLDRHRADFAALSLRGTVIGFVRFCLRCLADRESVSEKTAWMDWRVVNEWNAKDFEAERATMVSRLQAMRMRAIERAIRKGQLSSAAMMMDALGRVLGEAAPETLALEAPNLTIKVEKPSE